MMTSSQTIQEQATPAQWLERFEIFRERFRLGLIDESKFKEIARAFQFSDDLGHIWMPGATSNQWYIWDRKQWSAAMPPAQLSAPTMPLEISLGWGGTVPQLAIAKTDIPGAIETPAPRVEMPTELPPRSNQKARPTDVPERGRTRGPTKPTDLPR